MRTLIVGGGVAGLTLAALLRQRGIEPVVIEKAEHYGDIGYHLGLWPLGNRVLRGLGLSERFLQISVPFECWNLRDRYGRSLRSFDARRWMSRHGETRSLVRSELLRLLRSFGGGIPVRLGCSVTAISQYGDQVEVGFSDGDTGRIRSCRRRGRHQLRCATVPVRRPATPPDRLHLVGMVDRSRN